VNLERLLQIEELFHAAREGTVEERAALLAQADPEVRREVEALLSAQANEGFLDRPAIQNAAGFLENSMGAGLVHGERPGALPHREQAGPGRHGRGVSGGRHAPGPRRCQQGGARAVQRPL